MGTKTPCVAILTVVALGVAAAVGESFTDDFDYMKRKWRADVTDKGTGLGADGVLAGWRKTLDLARRQRSVTFCGEEPIARAITGLGYTAEQARTCAIWGCYEWGIRDSCNDTIPSYISALKPIERGSGAILQDDTKGARKGWN